MPNARLERGWEWREGKSYFSAELAESHKTAEQAAVERNGTLRRKFEYYTLSLFSAFSVLLLVKPSLEVDLLS